LVAPAFLFVAGLVFTVVSERKMEEFRSFGSAFRRQLGRLALILGIGYALHIPFFSFTQTVRETTDAGWLKFYQADVLHCIALGLLVMFVARLFLHGGKQYAQFLFILGSAAVLAAPFTWEFDFNTVLHPSVAAYMNSRHDSLFPLFPWAGFILFGGVVGARYLRVEDSESERMFVRRMTGWGVGLVVLYALANIPVRIPLVSPDIRANPLFFGLRFGIVLLLLAVCWQYARLRETRRSVPLDVSRETLLVYVAHLLIIYGTFWNERSLATMFGRTFTLLESLTGTIGLAALMVGVAKGWTALKQRSRQKSRGVAIAVGLLVTVIFFIK
ncbi:MAG: DUF1624 domain-containing protein, partial [Ignavibacteriales bacterium]|nr:DUF1624 domain-containing protein [Ignavibacteriales bacterium]